MAWMRLTMTLECAAVPLGLHVLSQPGKHAFLQQKRPSHFSTALTDVQGDIAMNM